MKTLIAALVAVSALAGAITPASAAFGPKDLVSFDGPAFGPKDLTSFDGPAFGPKDLVTGQDTRYLPDISGGNQR
jgi:hypothetical protein